MEPSIVAVPTGVPALYVVETDFGRSDPPVSFAEALREWRRARDAGLPARVRPYEWVRAEEARKRG